MIVGLDIGYSAAKLTYTDARGGTRLQTFPAGACPIGHLPKGVSGEANLGEAVRVEVNGEIYAALAEPRDFQNYSMPLHADYTASPEYRALFLASLFKVGARRIDCLVTGLPVSQAKDKVFRERVQNQLAGEHTIRDGISVKVDLVKVLAQPVGTWMNWLVDNRAYEEMDIRVLVFDVGYYSVDWVVLTKDKVHTEASGSSTLATSAVLEEASRLIQEDHGVMYSVPRLEESLRTRKTHYFIGDEAFPMNLLLDRAVGAIADNVLNAVRRSLRMQTDSLDFILLAGGGSSLYAKAVRAAFPRVKKFVVADDAVMANSRGFYYFGRALLKELPA